MLTNMEVVIDFEYLKGRQNEMFVRDLSLAAENWSYSFLYEIPYDMMPSGSDVNGLNWANGHIV